MFSNIFGAKPPKQQPQNLRYFNPLNGSLPTISNTNGDVYYNYLMRACLRAIATHVAKADVKHIRYVGSDTIPQNSDLANLLGGQPNPYMNSSEFIFKLTTNLLIHNNAFVYIKEDAQGNVVGLYPLNSSFVTYMESSEAQVDETGNLFVKFNFRGGQQVLAPYSQIIHVKRDYFENDLMGSYNDNALYPLLQLCNTVHSGIVNAVANAPANLRGSLHFAGVLKLSDVKKKADAILSKFFDIQNNGGIIITDAETGEFKPIENNAILLDAAQMDAIQKQVFGYYNISEKIVFSTYNEDELSAFYTAIISPILKQYAEAFTFKLFTERERGYGNKIIFTSSKLQYTSDKTKTAIIQYLAPTGALTINEMREMFGFGVIEGGERRVESLNFVDVTIKNDYQLGMAKSVQGKDGEVNALNEEK
ncbi:MAG: phage portal protein [Desulfosporosinus sp.]|nr:phage portal protein [Desulfosporosinus sp.]